MIYLKCATNDHLTDYAAPRSVRFIGATLFSSASTQHSIQLPLRFVSLICKIYLIL